MLWQKLMAPQTASGGLGTPTYFPMRNTAVDPTHSTWRANNAGYTFVPNDGIYTASPMTNAGSMLRANATYNDPDTVEWDMSNVVDTTFMFFLTPFDQDIGGWDMSGITTTASMFRRGVFNQDVGGWDMSANTTMNLMFERNSSFNQDLSAWCVSLIPSLPSGFDTNATAWVLPRPIWGTCP